MTALAPAASCARLSWSSASWSSPARSRGRRENPMLAHPVWRKTSALPLRPAGFDRYDPARWNVLSRVSMLRYAPPHFSARLSGGARNPRSPLMSTHLGKQAVVVGAGMAGLTAARALADHFERVIVIENDALPSDATPRPGIPQAKHAHALLAGGQQALSALFPGFEQDLAQAGAVLLRLNSDIRFERPGYDPFP